MQVSIIIPSYNRCHLIGETLESVLAQTYHSWECIVVDDGSIDYTAELMEFYCQKDARFKFHQRPQSRQKGANACRNYGFEMSKGKYIQWFDSDDLMEPDFLQIKVKTLVEDNVDFVISKSANFNDPDPEKIISRNEQYYRFKEFEVTNLNYVSHRINWLTYDFLGKTDFIRGIKFNENLKSGQERNFFCKLTTKPFTCSIIDAYLTKRRIHEFSIRSTLKNNKLRKKREDQVLDLETWRDISYIIPGSDSERFLLNRQILLDQKEFPNFKPLVYISKELWVQKRYNMLFWYFVYKAFYRLTGRGVFFRNQFKKSI